jgi:hypothetical protein
MWVEITEESVLADISSRGYLSRALAEDTLTKPPGALWPEVERLANAGKLVIVDDIARLP